MLNKRLILTTLCLLALAGCSLFADKPEPAPAPPPAPAPAPEPPQVIAPPPPPPPPPVKPATKPRPVTKPGKAGATKPIGDADEVRPEVSPARVTPKPAPKKSAIAIAGPEWLQFCSIRQQSPTGVLCDANTLLAQPSAKVQVYVREASLVRNTPGGRIQLREGLPRLYRFFVIP